MREIKLKDGSNVTIRKANQSDAKGIIEYIETISGESDFLTFGEGEFGVSIKQEQAFLKGVTEQKNALFIIAEMEGKIIGNLNFSGGPRPRTEHGGEFGMTVLKDYWGKGLGKELLKFLIGWSENSNVIRKINLRVRTDNTSAIKLYKKMGFEVEGTITREFKIKEQFYDALLMGRMID